MEYIISYCKRFVATNCVEIASSLVKIKWVL